MKRYFVRKESRSCWAVVDRERIGSGPVQNATMYNFTLKGAAVRYAAAMEASLCPTR